MKNLLYLMLILSLFYLLFGDMEIFDVKIFEVCFIFVVVLVVENNNNQEICREFRIIGQEIEDVDLEWNREYCVSGGLEFYGYG